ncbi:LOW QUALITY PROTEIN: Hypothetical protein PHPALM_4523 [Phytophthora palmivora]|uniref:Uncharacterized protein n=1 Tax=Phytophthora palmivora TaxID=4796 RepID=A0A2P4YJN4_9STRA|nr:LOW QUALITY PROTEIN: Hypothetical protein PHPALM_4523 [Phytophthora palmivora]
MCQPYNTTQKWEGEILTPHIWFTAPRKKNVAPEIWYTITKRRVQITSNLIRFHHQNGISTPEN